jgi:mRNA-degrading endonuclease RelE of RelBE toxin-antitoxin system
MSYKIIAVPAFKKAIKRLVKKYPSLKNELALLFDKLAINPIQGTALGNNCFKIRIAISSKGKGKSGGGRIITNIVVADFTVFLLSIYDKSEKDNISEAELKDLLSNVPKN